MILQVNVPARANLRLTTLAVAEHELRAGVREVGGANRGRRVSEYLAEANVREPAPWCAAYVNWCAKNAARIMRCQSPLETVPIQAYVQSHFIWAREHGLFVPYDQVLPGDLFILWYSRLGRWGHVGLVRERLRALRFRTIEGNTNGEGSREGDAVASKVRLSGPQVRFIRWTSAAAFAIPQLRRAA